MKGKIPITIQMQPGENGAAALCMILGYYKKYVSLQEMRELCPSSRNGVQPEQILGAAEYFGLAGDVLRLDAEELKTQEFPLLICWKKKYYAIIESFKGDIVKLVDPAKGEYKLEFEKLKELYTGQAIALRPGPDFEPGGEKETLYQLLKGRIEEVRSALTALLIFSVVCVLLDMVQTVLTRNFMDEIIGRTNYTPDRETNYLIALYGAVLLILVFSLLRTNLVYKTSRKTSAKSGSALFKKMFAQPLRFYEQYSASELMNRLDSNEKLDNTIIQSLVPRFIDAVMTILYIVLLLSYNWMIALVCLLVELINILLTLYAQEKNAIAARSMTTSTNSLNTSILNGMNMIDTIKASGAERAFYNMWHESQLQVFETRMASGRITRYSNFVSNILGYLVQAIQLFMGAYFVAHGQFTLGMMSLFQSVMRKMRGSLSSCLNTVNTLQRMRTNIERVDDINNRETREEIPLPEEEYGSVDKLAGDVVVRHVNFRYNNSDELAIKDVNLSVEKGQIVAVVGSTGCGKSTLLKLIADLYEPESGEILFSGRKRSEIPDVVFRSSVSTVDQETMVFIDTVYANIKMWDSTIEDYEVIMAACDAQIHDRIMQDKDGYSAVMLENGRNFSGGELQRLELARALSHEPTLLLLDEFTSALDALTEDKVIRSIREKGTTCFIVAHRLSTIMDCDRIFVMDRGRIVEEGTHDELYQMDGLYKKLIGSA